MDREILNGALVGFHIADIISWGCDILRRTPSEGIPVAEWSRAGSSN